MTRLRGTTPRLGCPRSRVNSIGTIARFETGPVRLRFTGGGIAVDERDDRAPDHRIVGDAAATALVVPYRRRVTTDPELLAFGERIESV